MKHAFYDILNALSVIEGNKNLWRHRLGNKIITTQYCTNILSGKGNQTMEFDPLIEYNKFFQENHTQNVVGKLVPNPFIKTS